MFILNRNTVIESEIDTVPVRNAIGMLERDRDKVLLKTEQKGGKIRLARGESGIPGNGIGEEQYVLEISSEEIRILAVDDLGWIYGLLFISQHYLGVQPFWFWMDQRIPQREQVALEPGMYRSEPFVVRFRGWFFNDEVLLLKWDYNDRDEGWRMAFEALLRCGGNMAIPGTDKMSRRNRKLAAEMGLWLTHHHAEPLGAEMFVRAYPDVKPNYMEHPELFQALWEQAVEEQKDYKVVWNLCFRGQGDSAKRGKMISDMVRLQCGLVRKKVEHPVFCTNLYGEIMELYREGYVSLDQDIIKVSADNGYGRMVTRRRDNHDPKVSSMPDALDPGMKGIYYHVSFYDLQAANHITMLPNSVEFVDRELSRVLENGGNAFWVINCSGVRPHVYYLDAIRKKWMGRSVDDAVQSREFARDYFQGEECVAECYRSYPGAMISYGPNEDDHAGEQFYNENIRLLAHQLLVDREHGCRALRWLTKDMDLGEQIRFLGALCGKGLDGLTALRKKCEDAEEMLRGAEEVEKGPTLGKAAADGSVSLQELFHNTLSLQSVIHEECAKGVVLFAEAYEAYEKGDYARAFVGFGRCAECFDRANERMRVAETGNWVNFYKNDCFADVKHTAYMVRKVMGLMRELGDNAWHDKWYREYCYAKEDQGVFLLLVLDNHMTDWDLYQVMKEQIK